MQSTLLCERVLSAKLFALFNYSFLRVQASVACATYSVHNPMVVSGREFCRRPVRRDTEHTSVHGRSLFRRKCMSPVCVCAYCVLRLVIRPQSAHLLLSFYACIYETNTLTHGQTHQQHKCTWVPRTIACTCNSHASMRDVASTTASMLLLLRLSCIQRKIAMLRSCVKHVGCSHAHLLHIYVCTTCVGCTRISCKIECACMLSVECVWRVQI